MTGYAVYDVFTDRAFGGNPLAVIPDARSLSEDMLQPLAREFGFSETVFLSPTDTPDRVRARIFTSTQEIPFAGHPLVGAAVALNGNGALRTLIFETGVGPISARVAEGRASITRKATLERLHEPEPKLVARCLRLGEEDVIDCVTASAGLPFTLARLGSREALSRCGTDLGAYREAHARYPTPFDFAIYAYVTDGDDVSARMFAPLDDIPEDPGTGSAAAALGLCLAAGSDLRVVINQGQDMHRPSRIEVVADADGVSVGGAAIRVMEGRITL